MDNKAHTKCRCLYFWIKIKNKLSRNNKTRFRKDEHNINIIQTIFITDITILVSSIYKVVRKTDKQNTDLIDKWAKDMSGHLKKRK